MAAALLVSGSHRVVLVRGTGREARRRHAVDPRPPPKKGLEKDHKSNRY